jgi:hypothetical protein
VATADNVVKVPNGALRYKPDLPADELHALYQQYGIPEGDAQRKQSSPAVTGQAAGAKPPERNSAAPAESQVVWKLLPDKSLAPVRIRTGITDHTFTELIQELNGDLKPGDDLVTGLAQGRSSSAAPRPGGPGVPRAR